MQSKRVLFLQPSLQPPGGGNGVGAWMLEALKHDHTVSLLTWAAPDFPAINRFFGTTLRAAEFRLHTVPPVVRRLMRHSPLPLGLLQHSYLLRCGQKLAPAYDAIMTASNEADFGRRGIQYIHFPRFERVRPDVDLRWYHRLSLPVDAYYRLCAAVAGFSVERMKRNLTLVNSDWIGSRVRELYGIEPTTLWPPVPGNFPDVPWEQREEGFLCIGRISPEKEIDKVIDIVAAVRSRGRNMHLHIVGTGDDSAYCAKIRRRAQENPGWVYLGENLSRDELVRLVATHRYGIHGMTDEHFGMAVGDLVRGGCITFVPCGGGQVEIIGDEDRLLYRTREDALHKIMHVLGAPDVQGTLRRYLAGRGEQLSTDRFVRRIRDLMQHFDAN